MKNSIRCGQTKNKGKIHGEEYWMVKYYQSLFPNVQMLAMLPVFDSQRCSQNKRRKETLQRILWITAVVRYNKSST